MNIQPTAMPTNVFVAPSSVLDTGTDDDNDADAVLPKLVLITVFNSFK